MMKKERTYFGTLLFVGTADFPYKESTLSAARFAAIIVILDVVGRIAPCANGRFPLRVVVAGRAAAAAGQFRHCAAIAHFSCWGLIGQAGIGQRGRRWAHRRCRRRIRVDDATDRLNQGWSAINWRITKVANLIGEDRSAAGQQSGSGSMLEKAMTERRTTRIRPTLDATHMRVWQEDG